MVTEVPNDRLLGLLTVSHFSPSTTRFHPIGSSSSTSCSQESIIATQSQQQVPESTSRLIAWIVRVFAALLTAGFVTAVLTVVAGIPMARWGAQRVAVFASGSSDSSLVLGIAIGALTALVVPLLLLLGSLAWRRRGGPGAAVLATLLAVLVGTPAAVTAAIHFELGSSAHAAMRILDVDGPEYLAGWQSGCCIGVTAYLVVAFAFGKHVEVMFGPVRLPVISTSSLIGYAPNGQPIFGATVNGQLVASTTGTNTMSIVALVLGLVGGFFAIPFGHIALRQIRSSGERGQGMAIAGLVLGYLSLLTVITLVALFLASVNLGVSR